MKKLLTRPDLLTTGDHGAEPADSPADATTVAHTPTSPTVPGQGSHRSMWMRLHSYVAEPWQRLADLAVIALVCAVSGLPYPILTALAVGIAFSVFPHIYRFRLGISSLDELPRRLVAAGAIATIAVSLINPGPESGDILTFAALMAVSLGAVRIVGTVVQRWIRRRRPELLKRTLILGSCDLGRELGTTLRENPEYGLRPLAIVDRASALSPDVPSIAVDVLDSDFPKLLQQHQAETVIIAFSDYNEEQLVSTLRACVREESDLYIIPRLHQVHDRDELTESIGAVPLRRINRSAHRSLAWQLKRPFDIVVSLLAMIPLAPVMAVLALLVKLDNPSAPVLFRQTRIGLDGKPFELLKFRSMSPATPNEGDTRWSIAGDQRISRLGRIMRRFSLDEFPQILNVIRGDMALVGPRPERPKFVELFGEEYAGYHARHRVPVGLTGWAAINGLRGDTSIADRVLYDNDYIENWSPWLDLKILVLTFRAVVGGTGA